MDIDASEFVGTETLTVELPHRHESILQILQTEHLQLAQVNLQFILLLAVTRGHLAGLPALDQLLIAPSGAVPTASLRKV